MALKISIVTGSTDPVYRQIMDQVRMAIASGALLAEDQLPSVRALAEQLVINPNTVARAYNELAAEGVIYSHPGKGLFVAKRRQVFAHEERLRRLNSAIDTLVKEVVLLGFDNQEILDRLKCELEKLNQAKLDNGDRGKQHE